MARVVAFGCWIAGAALCLLALELLLRLFPVSTATLTDYRIDPDILSYPSGHTWTTATGWDLRNVQHLQANNAGFLGGRDFVRDSRAVALVGDSYVEASMLGADERPQAQLEAALAGRPVFALGSPGTALLDDAVRVRYAREHYGVRATVLLMESGDVVQSLCGSGNVHAHCLDRRTLAPRIERIAPPGPAKRWLRHSALAQYVVGHLKVDPRQLWTRLAAAPAPASQAATPASPREVADAVARAFFGRIGPLADRKLVILVDDLGVRQRKPVPRDPSCLRFMELARQAGATVVDLRPLFEAYLERSPMNLVVGPYDGHFNAAAVRLAMTAAAEALRERGPAH